MRTLIVKFTLLVLAACAPDVTLYDQSQAGQLNVQIDLKNIEVVALLEDLGLSSLENIDYGDYSELTLKPPSLPSTTSVASSEWTSGNTPSTVASPAEDASSAPEASSGSPVASSGSPVASSGSPAASSGSPVASSGSPVAATGGPVVAADDGLSGTDKPIRKCGAGYYRDRSGRCRPNQKPSNNPLSGLFQRVQEKLKAATTE